MNPLVPVSVIAALGAGAAMLGIVASGDGAEEIVRRAGAVVAAAIAATVVTASAGLALDAAPLGFLIAMAAFSLPVLVLLDAAAAASGAGRVGRWLVLLVWAVVVMPVTAVVPLALTSGCAAPECRIEDFGGVLPLFVSSSAFLLLSRRLGVVRPVKAPGEPGSGLRSLAWLAGVWIAFAVWLASLEGAVDDYVARILLAAVVGPMAGVIGWSLVDVLRERRRPAPRSLALGLLAGMVAVVAAAVSVEIPWLLIAVALAGALGALVFGDPASGHERIPRLALSMLVVALVGFLAPAVSGNGIGVIFSGQFVGVVQPLLVFAAVAAFTMAVSLPVWLLVRQNALVPT